MSNVAITETSEYLTFTLDKEVYALEVAKVREVLEYGNVTHVPRTPEFMRGVINLRGNVVPLVDLKLKFGMERTEETIDTCNVIVDVQIDGQNVVLGAIADSVQAVITLEPEQIEPAPTIGTRLDTAFIKGMGKRNEEFVIILDIDEIFSANELSQVMTVDETSPVPEMEESADASAAPQ